MEQGMALMTVELTIVREDGKTAGIALGGDPEQAEALALVLAERFGVPAPGKDELLRLILTVDEVEALGPMMKEKFPKIGIARLDEDDMNRHERRRQQKFYEKSLSTKKPPPSPWRQFVLNIHPSVNSELDTDDIIEKIVVAVIDGLYHSWLATDFCNDPDRPFGAVFDGQPLPSGNRLRLVVVPAERLIHADYVPPTATFKASDPDETRTGWQPQMGRLETVTTH